MGTRVPASERTNQAIEEALGSGEQGLREVLQLAVRKLIEETLEAEVSDALGRGYYERSDSPTRGYRNGHRLGRLKTAEGSVAYSVPQVRDISFRSQVRPELGHKTEALEDLAVEMYARGLSTRDIEATFCDDKGRSLLSRTAVSALTERLWDEYEAFAMRDLSELRLVYLFVDGVAERLHPGQRREAVLCAWGITDEGQKVLIHLLPGTKEDTASCRAFFEDLKSRGLTDPHLGVTDGAPGLIRAFEECFPRSDRQRCLAHRMRNLQGKVSEEAWPEFREAARAAYQAPSPQTAQLLRESLVSRYGKLYPTAVKCFEDDFDACTAHLRYPLAHRKYIRTTNLLERLFEEERRRMKIVSNAFGERAVLKLMYASLLRGSERWRGIRMSAFEQRQLDAIREELNGHHKRRMASPIRKNEAKSPSRISSKDRT